MMNNKRSRNNYDGMSYSARTVRQQYNPYKEALLNPISGPLVGVPSAVPVDTHRVRLKATVTLTTTSGALTVLAQPIYALCSDQVPLLPSGLVGPLAYQATDGFAIGNVAALSNSPYTNAQFAGVAAGGASSVRGRVVSACVRICNVSAANTRNGVLTLFTDPQHNTLQSKTAASVATDPKARQYTASTDAWHTMTYHPVDPDEVDGWVWQPRIGPQQGVKSGGFIAPAAEDGTVLDNFPGYMGIWWKGDSVSQTFQLEMYVIAEFVGSLCQPLVRDIGVNIEDAQDARETAENAPVHVASAADGSDHTGHPHSSTHPSRAQRVLDFGKEHAGALKKIAKAGAIGVGGLIGGPQGAMAAAEYLLSAEDMASLGRFDAAQKKIRSKSSPATPSRRPAIGYGRQPQPGDLSNSRGDFRYRGPARIR